MTIYVRNRKGKFIPSIDNNIYIFHFHWWLARQRVYQLLYTVIHIAKGVYYRCSIADIAWFVKRHLKEQFKR